IALIGIHAVYPDGVRMHRMKMGPIQSSVERGRDNSIKTAIKRADSRASVTFAIGVMIATLFVVVGVIFCGSMLALNLLASLLGIEFKPLELFAVLFVLAILPFLTAIVIDRTYGTRLQPGSRVHRMVESVFRWSARVGMGINSNAIMSVLTTNDDKQRMLTLTYGIMFLSLCGVGASFALIQKPDVIGNYGLFPDNDNARIMPAHYDDQRNPARDGNTPYVQGMVVTGPYLRLVVPYNPRRNNPAMRTCKTPAPTLEAKHADALLACVGALHAVTLDGKPQTGIRYEISSDARTDRPALLAMIDVRALPPGRHELHVARPPVESHKWKDSPDPGFDRIVFWR
ncbi:MAG: hypothetical protein QM612_09270, partial [Thermomonas sp.]|uniref:hypothetical protein n=1 Tax=Thermomonas sp. TaxID=1971895 RepID=UPI0039E327AC